MRAITILLIFLGGSAWAQPQIVGAEYFFNSDPGVGNGTEVAVSPGNNPSISFTASTEGLEPGMNRLHVRVVNSEDTWSLFARKVFVIYEFPQSSDIVAAEWFIDDDPGVGQANDVAISSGDPTSVSVAIPLGDLDLGMHVLQVRVKNAADKWSLFGRRLFYILPAYPTVDIVEAEYFVDQDPGVGNGIPLEITAGQFLDENFHIALSDTLSPGDHLLNVRVRNDEDVWSVTANAAFTVDTEVGVQDLSADFSIYPNPTGGMVHVETSIGRIESIRVLDISGKVVLKSEPESRSLDFGPLPSGTYLLQIRAEAGMLSKLIIRE